MWLVLCRCLEHLGLGEALAALERYAFMGAGDWAAALVEQLADASISVEVPGPHDLHRMLDATVLVRALLSTCCTTHWSRRIAPKLALSWKKRTAVAIGVKAKSGVWPLWTSLCHALSGVTSAVLPLHKSELLAGGVCAWRVTTA